MTMQIDEPFTGIIALNDEKPIGLILADNHKSKDHAELFSFFVIPEERHKGVGKKLLFFLEKALKEEGVTQIQSRFWNNWGSIYVINKLLAALGWESPTTIKYICEGSIAKHTVAPWPHLKFPSGFSFFSWEDLDEENKDLIDDLIFEHKIPMEYDPFQHTDKIFYPASIGLKQDSRLVGWNIVYSLRKDMIEYNNLFVLDEYKKHGYGINLLKESFGRQYDLNIPNATWIINADNPTMVKVFQRITTGHLSNLVEVKACRKNIG
jgi:GNAT superfamily N-acetyltransferase